LISVIIVAVFLFLPADPSILQGWAFMALWFLAMLIASPYFLMHDPQLVEAQTATKEKRQRTENDLFDWRNRLCLRICWWPGLRLPLRMVARAALADDSFGSARARRLFDYVLGE